MKISEINTKQIWDIIRPIEELKKDTTKLIKDYNLESIFENLKHKIFNVSSEIIFEPKEHRYFFNGEECIAVSHVVNLFVKETDFDQVAQNYVKKNNLSITWQRLRETWKLKADAATTNGTFVHQYGEDLNHICNDEMEAVALKDWCLVNGYYQPIHPKAIAIYKYFEYLLSNKEVPFLAEVKLILKEHFITGTFDQLVWSVKENGLIMRDYKTNETLTKSFKKPMKAPFELYNDEALSHYILQQNIYSLMLKEIGIDVLRKELVWVKDNEQFELIKLPDLEDIVLKGIESLY